MIKQREIMSEQKPLTINQLIKMLKKLEKQAGNLPVMFYVGNCDDNKVYTHLCKEPKEIKIMIDFNREEGDVLRHFALIK